MADDSRDDVLVPPEANYRRLSTPKLLALRVELVATRDRRRRGRSKEAFLELADELEGGPSPLLAEFVDMLRASAADQPGAQDVNPDPFFDNRIACVDRILAERSEEGRLR